jgi:hypothetical protein
MSFKKAETTLASAVADNGTFTVSYPAGTQAGSYAGAHAHKMWAAGHQKMYSAPNDFTLSFGASDITVTYKGSTTLPAGSRVQLQLDILGADDGEPAKAVVNGQIVDGHLAILDLGSPITADADGFAASQTVTGAGTAFALNGVLVSNGVGINDVPRNVVAAWTNTAVLTITGTDVDGYEMVETSASGTSHTGTKAFKTITSVTTSATVTSATVGQGVAIGLPVYLPGASHVIAELKNGVVTPRRPGVVYLQGRMLAAAVDAGTSYEITSPVAGAVRKLTIISEGSTTTGGAVTVEVATVAVDGLSVTVANSSAAGDIDVDTATLGHASTAVAIGDRIEIIPASAFNAAADLAFILEIDTTAAGQLDGTLVAGVTSAATGTTGDVRGTYSPLTAPDGASGYKLVAILPDPANKGVPQYTG